MELILMRHATTQGNLERRFIGTLDVPILPQGEVLARQVSPTLPTVEHLYRSPLLRCDQTARLLWPEVAHTVIPDLRETDFGSFEGKNHEELQDNPLYLSWLAGGSGLNFAALPVGEHPDEVAKRVMAGLCQVVSDATARGFDRVAVVSHGGTMMGLLAQVGRPEREYYGWMCKNCCGYRMAVEGSVHQGITLQLQEELGT